MLHILLREKESPSETGSYTDSGKGPSEEGDHSHSWPDCHVDAAKGMQLTGNHITRLFSFSFILFSNLWWSKMIIFTQNPLIDTLAVVAYC